MTRDDKINWLMEIAMDILAAYDKALEIADTGEMERCIRSYHVCRTILGDEFDKNIVSLEQAYSRRRKGGSS